MAKNKQKKTEQAKPKTVKTVADFLQVLNNTQRYLNDRHFFLYRGHANYTWKLASSAYRRLSVNRKGIKLAVLLDYIKKLLSTARMRGLIEEGGKKFSDLELLAQLQHYGAATCFIDFTKNPLIALWFACQSSKKQDGQVIIIPTADTDKFSEVTLKEFDKNIDFFFRDNKLWKWTPQYHLNRIVAQNSVFVFGKNSIDTDLYKINIAGRSKQDILTTLKNRYGIDESYLFSDFAGFANINAHDKEYKDYTDVDYFYFGTENHQKGAYKEAIEDYGQAIALDSEFTQAYNNRGNVKSALGRYEEAIEDYDKAIALDPKYTNACNNRGNAKSALGDKKGAIEDYDQAIEINSLYVEAYSNRGAVKFALNEHEEAIQDFDQAIEIHPWYAEAYYNRGCVEIALGKNAEEISEPVKSVLDRYKEAIKDFDQVIEINPQHAEAYNRRGFARQALGEHKEAIQDHSQAIKINPKYALAYSNRGSAKHELGEYEEAIQDFDRAIALDSQDVATHDGLRREKLASNEKITIQYYYQAIRIKSQLVEAYNNRGDTKNKLGDVEGAQQDYDQAIKIKSQLVEDYNLRGAARREIGDEEGAQQDFAMAEKLKSERD